MLNLYPKKAEQFAEDSKTIASMRGVVDPRDIKRISIICAHVSQIQMDVSKNGGTQQPWVSYKKMIILGCFGDPLFLETTRWVQMIFPGRFVGSTRRSKSSSKVKWIYDPKPHAMVIGALHRAALHGHHAVVKALLLAKADVEERDDEGGDLVGWNDDGEVWSPGFLITFFFGGMDVDICFFLPWKGMCKWKNILKQMGGVS